MSPLPANQRPFGMEDIKLQPIVAGVPTGALVDLPAAQRLTFSAAEEFKKLRGDNKDQTSRGMGEVINWSMSSGGISYAAWALITGGTIGAVTGVAPAQTQKFSKNVSQQRPEFLAIGQSIGDAGGDTHIVLYRCKATGNVEGEFADGEFWVTACSGEALPSEDPARVGQLYDFINHETAAAIVAP